MLRPRPFVVTVLVGVLALIGSGCGDEEGGAAASVPSSAARVHPVEGRLTVFAAASLTDAFEDVGRAFADANPGADPTFSFDASSALVDQIARGAPADVFASADEATMDRLTETGLNGTDPVVFATNRLAIIVGRGNPKGIGSVEDLADPDVKVIVCADQVPCGRYATEVFADVGVRVSPVSYEQNVRGVVTKVTTGEADAGIVYATDVGAAGEEAEMVEIPDEVNVVVTYPIATVLGSSAEAPGQAFIDFVAGPGGQAILADHGFGPP